MSLEDIAREFPNLQAGDFSKTSDEDDGYNCIAWAVDNGKTDNWWSPIKANGYYWPENIPRGVNIDAFVLLYQTCCGYERCDNGDYEDGFEKLALYVDLDDEFSHVARQLPNGAWTSKLGVYDDISHVSPFVLEADYGKIKAFLKRKTPAP